MGNPLLTFWYRIFGSQDTSARQVPGKRLLSSMSSSQASASIFLILRRMRAPLIVLICIFSLSVLGMTLIPGQDASGRPTRMGVFESFYFMSSTATTIGFGEIPHSFTAAQRLWVTFTIYLAVIGWAYAIGSLLALMQDRGFRRALGLQHFARKVSHLHEPFLLVVGYGDAGQMLARSLDAMGRRLVVLDIDETRIASLDVESFHVDVPGLVGDARETETLATAGLAQPNCEGVLALTDDDEANLAVTMAVALLRPDLRVIASTVSRQVVQRMEAFGAPEVVNPFDRFGDHLRILLRSPASYQLMVWLTSAPGTELPSRLDRLAQGRWVVCGHGRFGSEITDDLRAEGVDVTVIEAAGTAREDPSIVFGDGTDPNVLRRAGVAHAIGFVAATESDPTNLSLVAAARQANPSIFLVARQNGATNSSLFQAIGVDFALVAARVIAHETLARLANPMLMRFLEQVPRQGEAWSVGVLGRLVDRCGDRLTGLWRVRLNSAEAPALTRWLAAGGARLGDMMRAPYDRNSPLDAVVLLILRDGERFMAPDDDFLLAAGDELLLTGPSSARRSLSTTLMEDAAMEYVLNDRHVPSGWVWRHVTRQ